MPDLDQSVGNGGVNRRADVKIVQKLLNQYIATIGIKRLVEDGLIGPKTIKAIRRFQTVIFGIDSPNGRADPGGRTITALNNLLPGARLSGADWWHANQARFPNSDNISDLRPPFRDRAARFVNAVRRAGATVTISSTRRNRHRAYLMHYCWQIGRNGMNAADVPLRPECPIKWDHGDAAASKKAAKEMIALFGLAHIASLNSRHIRGDAIDMKITWDGNLAIKDAHGNRRNLNAPRNGQDNQELHDIGASYGVKKLRRDPPHWSSDGR